jgi:MFS transporter, AAHS family, 4-hydroxybenzoate transporter
MSTAVQTVDVSAIINGRRLNGFNYGLVVLSWFITVFDGYDMMMVSFTASYMRDEFGLSKMMLGRVFSAGLVGMMLGGFFFAFLADRIGRRPTVVIAAFGFGLLTTATAFAGSYEALLALRFLDGLALGGMLPLAWALNIEFVPVRMRSTIVTIIMMGYGLGTFIAGPMTNWLAPQRMAGRLFGGRRRDADLRGGPVAQIARVHQISGHQGVEAAARGANIEADGSAERCYCRGSFRAQR